MGFVDNVATIFFMHFTRSSPIITQITILVNKMYQVYTLSCSLSTLFVALCSRWMGFAVVACFCAKTLGYRRFYTSRNIKDFSCKVYIELFRSICLPPN